MLREFTLTGGLRQVFPVGDVFGRALLSDVSDDGPWPDIVSMTFEDASGRSYRLIVETFHGAGGEWTPLDD
jgi:hypothetical protein